MAHYYFGASGNIGGRTRRFEFEFEDDTMTGCKADGIKMKPETAEAVFELKRVFGPGYVSRGEIGSRMNIVNFLRWEAFKREPEFFGDPGPLDIPDEIEGEVY